MFIIPSWAIGVAIIIIAAQVSKAIFGGKSRRGPVSPENEAEIAELRQNVDAMQTRILELEERVDFTERLLAKQKESDRLHS
ncbi:MAG TPA: hypothetical protein VH439_09905 [Gemmatimonadales bacterium]|jgi:hypothetical protein